MSRQPSQRELVRELLALSKVEADAQEFEAFLRRHSTSLRAALGATERDLLAPIAMEGPARAKAVRNIVREAASRQKQVRAELNRNLALAAATLLAGLARWREDSVMLDPRIALGNLLVDATAKAVCFDAERLGKFVILRSKLKQARKELRFPDLECYVDGHGLNFRWRGGAGGLLLTHQELPRKDRQSVVPVVLCRTRTKQEVTTAHWAARALSDVAFA